ncbi:MAG: DNA polymerase I [Mollicutes bacterium]|nr:DNA polymerase I [Mollicutes bacterium]
MKKIILVDGNNLLFRSYYATAYSGNFMHNSKGFPTNALFGFANMINKIVLEEKPEYMIVAFDKGKTFRHEKYEDYKAGRIEMPDELRMQFPVAKELLTYIGIKYYEIDNYEADDIIGTFSKFCNEDSEYIGTIISSDRDLLQLLSSDVDIKLLKQKDYIRYDVKSFKKEYGIDPIKVIDLKALEGDASDNIPGVKGIGEKTALKLLQEYGSLDGIYQNIDKISGKLKEKLLNDKENAYMSYELATINCNVPIDINIEDIKYLGNDHKKLNALYEELEFYSFLKKEEKEIKDIKPIDYKIINNIDEIKVTGECAIYLEILGSNYHKDEVLGMAVYNKDTSFFIPLEVLKENPLFLKENIKYTYDLKKTYVALKWNNIELNNVTFDTMIAGYLLDYNVKDDIAYLANQFDYDIAFYENVYGKSKLTKPSMDIIAYNAIMKAKFIYDSYKTFVNKLKEENLNELFYDIEMPLSIVLGNMEYTGVNVDRQTLINMGEEIKIKMELVSQDIYNDAGEVFNISSPIQLSEILFEKLGLPHGKKGKTGYSTAIDTLNKLKDKHPIINKIIEYRMLTKLYTTYIEGLLNTIMEDNKIHTIYTQTLTRTGRLSSIEPNLQNIPIRYEYGKLIRKAFVPSKDSVIVSGDYSQIELRILAHMAEVPALIEAFKNDMDIHTKTAMDIFHVNKEEVNSNMRRIAKAVNFGIIYGISGFGLSENLDIPVNEAKKFIDDYLVTYPGIKDYMDKVIKNAYLNGYVKTLFNRKRVINELNNKNYMIRMQGERIALNTPIQGTSADIIKKAMIEIYKKMKEMNLQSKIILQVHDELVFDVLKSELEIMKKLIKDVMENVYELKVPLKVDIQYGDNWYQVK